MSACRNHLARRVKGLLLVALMLVPLALAGHHHAKGDVDAAATCAVCAVTHHTPAAKPIVQPCIEPTFWRFTRPVLRAVAPAEVFQSFASGRAPPRLFTVRVA
jgi:hypothetical protein